VRILNRIVTWTENGIEYEPDQRHAEVITHELGLKGEVSVVTPGVPKEEQKSEDGDEALMDEQDAKKYRGITARANYLAQDRTDIRYAVKEMSR